MNDVPKSAYELAMERLRKKDADEGIVTRTMTDEQKAEIGQIRQTFTARLAQEEILHASRRLAATDFDELQKLDDEYRRDVQRLNDDRERQIEKVRERTAG